jgi:hypothetical protein
MGILETGRRSTKFLVHGWIQGIFEGLNGVRGMNVH